MPEEKPTKEELIQRYANVQKISYEDAEKEIGADDVEVVLKNIEDKVLDKIRSQMPPMNRAQRRALAKKNKNKKKVNPTDAIAKTAAKIDYVKLIEELRKLNEKKEKENEQNVVEAD